MVLLRSLLPGIAVIPPQPRSQCFLHATLTRSQARTMAEPIIATVALMAESGLPCFSYGRPLANLRKRFHLEMTEVQASSYMRNQITDSYDKWTTGFYDFIQNKQNRIPY